MEITGAQLFVKALKEEKVTILFGYPGGQAIDLFDALYGEEAVSYTHLDVYKRQVRVKERHFR